MTGIECLSLRPVAAGNSWLLRAGDGCAVLDTGFACTAREAAAMAAQICPERAPERILLSHSHYDHASGTVLFSERFPAAEICAGAHAAHVFSRPGALRTMRELNATAAREYDREPDDASLEQLRVDRVLREGDSVAVGSVSFEVWETPGHTQCSLSFFAPEVSLLLASETMGIPNPAVPGETEPMVVPACMTGVESALRAIRRALDAQPEAILVPHTGVLRGEAARQYLRGALTWTARGRDLVLEGAAAGRTEAELIGAWKALFYTPQTARIQPEAAFDLNAGYIIPAILREYAQRTV